VRSTVRSVTFVYPALPENPRLRRDPLVLLRAVLLPESQRRLIYSVRPVPIR